MTTRRSRAAALRPVATTSARLRRRRPWPLPWPSHEPSTTVSVRSKRSGQGPSPIRISTDPRSRTRAIRRLTVSAPTRWRGATTTRSREPTRVPTTSPHAEGSGGDTSARRSRATPTSPAATSPRSGSPTTAAHEPADVAPAMRAMARERAPGPETPRLLPRLRPSGTRPARAGRTGSMRSTARVVGLACRAASTSVGTGRRVTAGGAEWSSGGRSSNGSGSARREEGRATPQYRTYVRLLQARGVERLSLLSGPERRPCRQSSPPASDTGYAGQPLASTPPPPGRGLPPRQPSDQPRSTPTAPTPQPRSR